MATPQIPRVEVAYARNERQCLVTLELAANMTAGEALRKSGLLEKFPEIAVAACTLGICGRPVAPERVLRAGERVEIYRPLKTDPKEARRERARSHR